jgi:hypothetical protein
MPPNERRLRSGTSAGWISVTSSDATGSVVVTAERSA